MNDSARLLELRQQRKSGRIHSLMTQLGNSMNGTLKWILIAIFAITSALGGIVWENVDDGIDQNAVAATLANTKADDNKDEIDSLGYHVKELKLEQRVATKEQNIQLEQIAIATGAKVTIDTSTVIVDTIYVKDST